MTPKFRFHPHCTECSKKQAAILSAATRKVSHWWNHSSLAGSGGGSSAHFHGLKFRLNHLAGGVVAATTIIGANEREIANGNLKRFDKLQRMVQDVVTRPTTKIPSMFHYR